jgi:hypothetical protein
MAVYVLMCAALLRSPAKSVQSSRPFKRFEADDGRCYVKRLPGIGEGWFTPLRSEARQLQMDDRYCL